MLLFKTSKIKLSKLVYSYQFTQFHYILTHFNKDLEILIFTQLFLIDAMITQASYFVFYCAIY
jgi:hypothetical protein